MAESGSARPVASVLLTGASGFVGGALLPALRDAGVIRCLVRDATRLSERQSGEVVEADLADRESLVPALEGMDEVYYLVHSMEPGGGQGFAERDRTAAENYVEVARAAGVRRTIYLGGIRGTGEQHSEHLASRQEVEDLLATAGPELVALHASMIVGSGSASFGTLVRIVSRLPVLAMPAWRESRTQPIAIDDVVACLVAARDVKPGAYDIAGPDELTIAEMTEVVTELLGETHRSFPLPFSNARLEAAVTSLVTGEDRELLEPLMQGLHGDLTVERNDILDVFGVEPTPFAKAARQAIAEMPDVETS
ncbi:MAG TPA: NAD(P)H-binding protein [Solirubrobacteraceae bacterium]|nr:NAD(P)H-binding protein [Solirubrobacteraceae bacterium]